MKNKFFWRLFSRGPSEPTCRIAVAALTLIISAGSAEAAAGSPALAGLKPDQRPAAPVVREVVKTDDWYRRAFTGVEQPYPWSLQFIHQQGNWHNPFMAPGMTGPYDLRGWHGQRTTLPGEEKNRNQ